MRKIAVIFLFFVTLFIFNIGNSNANETIEQNPDALIKLLETELSKSRSNYRYEKVADELLELIMQDKFEEVEKQISTLIAEKKLTQNGVAYFPELLTRWFGHQRIRIGKFPKNVLPHINKWIEEYPNSAIAYTVRGKYYIGHAWDIRGNSFANKVRGGAWTSFRENLKLSYLDLQKAYELDKSIPYALQLMMTLDSSSQEFVEQIFQTIVKDYPTLFYAHEAKLVSLMPKWGGSWSQMFDFANKTSKNAPAKTLLPLMLAHAHQEAGKRSENKGRYYNSGNVWKEVKNSYERIIGDFPNSARWRAEFADIAVDANKRGIAYKQIEEAIKIDPYNKRIYRAAKNLFSNKNELGKQAVFLKKFVELYPKDHWGFQSLGLSLKKQKNFQEAADAFSKAIELNPYDAWSLRQRCVSYNVIAYNYNKPAYYKRAIADCSKVIEMTPNDKRAYLARGRSYTGLGKRTKAGEDYKMYEKLK